MTTDFRAGGLLALTQLEYFASHFPSDLRQAIKIESEWFFLALVSIRLSHLLIIMLNLFNPDQRK